MSRNRERVTFEPESIRPALLHNLPDGLRALADALEAGELQGRCTGATANGLAWDNRPHIHVTLDLSAEWEFARNPQLELPAPPPSLAMEAKGGQQQ